jgi:conjugal transfer pilus assembly protein TraB
MSTSVARGLEARLAAVRLPSRHRLAIWLMLLLAAVLVAGATLLPASAPRAAGSEGAGPELTPGATADIANFGAATPTEKFVQSFQQQVSQQLQDSLAQASAAQESRLKAFEEQQRQLGAQMQAIEQSVASANSSAPAGARDIHSSGPSYNDPGNVEPPRVNVRRADPSEPTGDRVANLLSGLGSNALVGAPGEPAAELASLSMGRPAPIATGTDHLGVSGGAPLARGRPADANVAPHGFIEGRLLNGVVALQGGAERDSIVALSGSYQSANGFTTDLDGCLALVQGRPEIATGRIDFKLSRLTCNFPDGASRTWDASGWLVDADGIRGIRAVIVDNTARKAGVAAAGGALGGLGQHLSQQQYEVSGGPVGFGPSANFSGSSGRDALGGAASGAANALGQSIADYYNLYGPSLQVGGGTPVTVVLANDLRLPPSGREISQTHAATP